MRRWLLHLGLIYWIGLLAGCSAPATYAPTPTKTPDPAYAPLLSEATRTPTPAIVPPTAMPELPTALAAPASLAPTAGQTATTTPERTGTPAASSPPPLETADLTLEASALLMADHYWLRRPIDRSNRDYLDRTYPYGGTSGGKYRPHTGVEFFNPAGTPVLAVANATVAYAGTDAQELYGPQPNFYGNLIVLQLSDVTYGGQPVYVLYGHLSAIDVEVGHAVSAGEEIGKVGGTGIANGGAHLHFEVRIGDPKGYFTSTRNPDLWISPYPGYGTLAGRIVGADGAPLREVAINVRGEDMPRYTWTYAGDENIPDDEARENFTYGDLPEGWYTVSASSGTRTYNQRVYVQAGRTSLLEIVFEN